MRTSELIAARWEEFNFEEALWTIPAERMKGRRGNRREHIVPLSCQAAALFQAQHPISGPSGPSSRASAPPPVSSATTP